MSLRSPIQNLWNAARGNLARLNRLLAESGNSDDMIFDIRDPNDGWKAKDRERRAIDRATGLNGEGSAWR